MRPLIPLFWLAISAVAGGAAVAKDPDSPRGAMTCAWPVGPRDTARALMARLGADAVIEDVAGAEGQTTKTLVLYPRDEKRRLEVFFYDDAMTEVSEVRLGGGDASVWSVAGLRKGDGLAKIVRANGRAFDLSGFDWDYGGYVTNLRGGALSRLNGGCSVGVRLAPPSETRGAPGSLFGDRKLRSTDPALVRLKPVISELSVRWRKP